MAIVRLAVMRGAVYDGGMSVDPPPALPETAVNVPQRDRGLVILMHGLAANSWFTVLLARRLRCRGYEVQTWGYWSFGNSLSTLTPRFRDRLARVQASLPPGRPLHLVGHSLGVILLRAAICELELPSLQRMVWLSPPHHGSGAARLAAPFLGWLTPLLRELSDAEESAVRKLSCSVPSHVEIGTIAAEWDAVVAEESTRLGGECDYLIMPSRHSGLLFRWPVAEQILHFLEHGRFARNVESCPPERDAAHCLDENVNSPG